MTTTILYRTKALAKVLPYAVAFTLIFTTGCSKKESPNMVEEIKLGGGELTAVFHIPNAYKPKVTSNSILTINFRYPGFEPLSQSSGVGPDGIHIYLQLAKKHARTERMIKEAGTQYDPALPGKDYLAGKEGTYE